MPLYFGNSGAVQILRGMYTNIGGTIYPLMRMYTNVGGVIKEIFAGVQLEQIPMKIVGTGNNVNISWEPISGYQYSFSMSQDGGSGYAAAGFRLYGVCEGDQITLSCSTCGEYIDTILVDGETETRITKSETSYVKKAGKSYIDLMCHFFLGPDGADWVAWYLYNLSINGKVIV